MHLHSPARFGGGTQRAQQRGQRENRSCGFGPRSSPCSSAWQVWPFDRTFKACGPRTQPHPAKSAAESTTGAICEHWLALRLKLLRACCGAFARVPPRPRSTTDRIGIRKSRGRGAGGGAAAGAPEGGSEGRRAPACVGSLVRASSGPACAPHAAARAALPAAPDSLLPILLKGS